MTILAPIVLRTIDRTSPSLWADMRLCGLRALLASTPRAQNWVLHDPRAWLGTAFHFVMSAARNPGVPDSLESAWNNAVAKLASLAMQHPLDRRFAAPEKWPSYFIIRQRALALASANSRPATVAASQAKTGTSSSQRGSERRFEARGGKLVGRPDYFDGVTITEYKSSLPNPEWQIAPVIIEGFRRQLRLYAAIIGEATGKHPDAARVVAASGEMLAVPIERAACREEADAAMSAMDSLNTLIAAGTAVDGLAAVSPESCGRCFFKLLCDAFWHSLPASSATSDGIFVGSAISKETGADGDLYSVDFDVRASNQKLAPRQRIVLRKSIHGDLNPSIGDECRLIDGRVGADGRIRADISTVVVRTAELPMVATYATGAPQDR
jgi:hypothetical protein